MLFTALEMQSYVEDFPHCIVEDAFHRFYVAFRSYRRHVRQHAGVVQWQCTTGHLAEMQVRFLPPVPTLVWGSWLFLLTPARAPRRTGGAYTYADVVQRQVYQPSKLRTGVRFPSSAPWPGNRAGIRADISRVA